MRVIKTFGEFTVEQPKQHISEGLRIFHLERCRKMSRACPHDSEFGYTPWCGWCGQDFPDKLIWWLERYLKAHRLAEKLK